MFGSLGVPEMLFILGLALLVFGPKRLPELGRTIGRALGEFRRASTDLRRSLNNELALEEESPRRPALAPDPPSRSQGAVTTIAAPVPAAHAQPRASAPDPGAPDPGAPDPGTAESDSAETDSAEAEAAAGVGAVRAPGAPALDEPVPAVEPDAPAAVEPAETPTAGDDEREAG